jgi:hypothetical protein
MEPIPYYYDSINRNAIVVKPKQSLFNWVNSIYPESPIEAVNKATVYLIKERDSNEAMEKWLHKNFDNIFQNELNDWHTEKKTGHRKEPINNYRVV